MTREKNQSSETMCSKFEINFLRLLPWGTAPLSSPMENFLGKILLDLRVKVFEWALRAFEFAALGPQGKFSTP